MLEQALLIVIIVLVVMALYMISRLNHNNDNNKQLLDPINTLTVLVKKLQMDNQQLLAGLQSQQKLLLQIEAKQAKPVVVATPPTKPVEKPPTSTLSMSKVNIKKPDELLVEPSAPDVLDIPVLAANSLTSSNGSAPQPDYQNALKKAVNGLLQQQARINTQQLTEQLKKIPEISSTINIQTCVYYLDGTPSEALAELVIIVFNGQHYVVPHYNSFSNPYLSRWFDLGSTQQVAIIEWPVISFNDDSKVISCIQKGKINL